MQNMTDLSPIPGGQPVETCPQAGPAPVDKWALLDALTHAAPDFGISHRTLTVLRALLTFFPDRTLPAQRGAGVVYPSNRTLSQRLNGMPESTLRRHLGTLVRSGLIDRQDSANRKRFARFGVCFGFDLSPLARFAEAVFAAAHQAQHRKAQEDALRAVIAANRQKLIEEGTPADDPLLEEARLCQRRKLPLEVLTELSERVENRLTIPARPAKMSGSDSQTERHIQTTDKSISVYNPAPAQDDRPPAIEEVQSVCKEYQAYFPTEHPDWRGLVSVSDRLHPMLGIDRQVYVQARQTLGAERTATIVLCMLESLETIRKPGAYLRALVQRGEKGLLNLPGMVKSLKARQLRGKLSADNFGGLAKVAG